MPAMPCSPSSPCSPLLALVPKTATMHPYTTLAPPVSRRTTTAAGRSAPRTASACRGRREHAHSRRHWARVASPQHASPGPPLFTLSIAVAAPTRLTRSRVLAPPAAVDTVDIFPRTPPQSRMQCVVARPSPTSPSRALASPGCHLPSAALTHPHYSPETPRPCRPRRRPPATSRRYKRSRPRAFTSTSNPFPSSL
jgi:hypothetical protein